MNEIFILHKMYMIIEFTLYKAYQSGTGIINHYVKLQIKVTIRIYTKIIDKAILYGHTDRPKLWKGILKEYCYLYAKV